MFLITSVLIYQCFLQRDCNKGFAEVTGSCVHQGAGYGIEGAMHLQAVSANHLHSTTATNHTVATRERTFVLQACSLG